MAEPKPRIRLSANEISAGDVIDVRTLISHTMESGQRRDSDGNTIPRMIINTFRCEFNGQPVFSCDIEPAISANPYIQFNVAPKESGTLTMTWIDDEGTEVTATEEITVN
jgi:sulfur-oxidizing protein SoxZ